MTEHLDDFIESYVREIDFYREAARLCAQQCEKMLDENGIRAMVTFRAKRADRLYEKILRRNNKKAYTSREDIRDDIVEFAGARVALYFPGDRERFERLMSDAFDVIKSKTFPDGRALHSSKRFTDYHATHFRVRLKAEALSDDQRRYASTIIEIQIASVLMHAWSEVEHDLIYKPATGSLSEEEFAILDQINGLVLAGEIGLERLQRAVEARVARLGSAFSNHYELAAFLYEQARVSSSGQKEVEPIMGRVDILFDFLKEANLSSPDALRPYITALDSGTELRPIADQVADRVIAEDETLYQAFIRIKERAVRQSPYTRFQQFEGADPNLVGEFLSRWIIFERFSRMLSRERDLMLGSAMMRHPSPTRVLESLEFNQATMNRVRHLRDTRNDLVHGVRIPDQTTLQAAIQDFDTVFAALDESPDPGVKAAMRWARSGEDDQKAASVRSARRPG